MAEQHSSLAKRILKGNKMSDGQCIEALINVAADPAQLVAAQHDAAARLLKATGIPYPHDGCAITLSVLLQDAGIDVSDTYQALALGKVLKERGWDVIPVGSQRAGDVGSTCGPDPKPGYDHIYLVLKALSPDEMVIADNQAQNPHFRFASGQGKTPTKFFLRAPA